MSIPKISSRGVNVHLQNKHWGGGGVGGGEQTSILKISSGGQMSGSHFQLGGKCPFILFTLGGKCPGGQTYGDQMNVTLFPDQSLIPCNGWEFIF